MVTLTSPGAGNSPQAVNVTYTITPLPAPAPTIISNAASGVPGPVSPGEIISIYGTNLGPSYRLPTVITGGSVQNAHLRDPGDLRQYSRAAAVRFGHPDQYHRSLRGRGQGFDAAGRRVQEYAVAGGDAERCRRGAGNLRAESVRTGRDSE